VHRHERWAIEAEVLSSLAWTIRRCNRPELYTGEWKPFLDALSRTEPVSAPRQASGP
jgi:hypothetical protein